MDCKEERAATPALEQLPDAGGSDVGNQNDSESADDEAIGPKRIRSQLKT
jgi:hypothetical protein